MFQNDDCTTSTSVSVFDYEERKRETGISKLFGKK